MLTVPLLAMIVDTGATWSAAALWVALCITDGIDGHIARRQGTTRSGAFLDPLADKVLVLGAMFALVANDTFWWLPVGDHHGARARHPGVPLLLGQEGPRCPRHASWPRPRPSLRRWPSGFGLLPVTASDATWVATGLLWAAVVLTVVTGVQYVQAGSRGVTRAGSRDRSPADAL